MTNPFIKFLVAAGFMSFVVMMIVSLAVFVAWDITLYNPSNWHEIFRLMVGIFVIGFSLIFIVEGD